MPYNVFSSDNDSLSTSIPVINCLGIEWGRGTVSVEGGGLLVAGMDGPEGQVIRAQMVQGTFYSQHERSGGPSVA